MHRLNALLLRHPSHRRVALTCLALALIAALSFAAHRLALARGRLQLQEAAQARLDVEAARLDAQLDRFAVLPSVLETAPRITALLARPADGALRDLVNRDLRALNTIAGADNLYVLDRSGVVVAAADAGQPGTPYGMNLAFRPYMQEALDNGSGRFYGVGITSGRAGYYLSYALPHQGPTHGVAVVKADLELSAQQWAELPGDVLVLDEQQVVILASRAAWKYRPLEALSAQARAEIDRSRRYGSATLQPLAWRWQTQSEGGALVRLDDGSMQVAAQKLLNAGRWRMVLLLDEAPARNLARTIAASTGLGAAVAALLLALLAQRRRAIRARLASRDALQAAHDSLERKVAQRTAQLQAAQADLVHAGKLAALGQMSAGLVHEFNQPLAALQTLADNTVVFAQRGRTEQVQANLERIGQLVARLGRLTRQLRVFAHRGDETLAAVPLRTPVDNALALLATRLRDAGITVEVAVTADLVVRAEEVRLEQVFINLLANAADALAGQPAPRITVAARSDGRRVTVAVRNSGPPIAADILQRLFEPFVTSKPAGQGLGLGLVISAHIVRAFGGSLRARNLPDDAGVEFTVDLPSAATSEPVPHA